MKFTPASTAEYPEPTVQRRKQKKHQPSQQLQQKQKLHNNMQLYTSNQKNKCLGSIAGVPFDSAGRFRATLLLRTTCMRLCCT